MGSISIVGANTVQTSEATLAPFSPGSEQFRGAVKVFVETWGREPHAAQEFFCRHAVYRDYYGIVALLEGQAIGMGFGTRSEPGQWWHDHVARHVGVDHPALRDAWVLTELAVLPGHRGHGIGARLHDALLAAQPCPRALLSTRVDNVVSRRLYESRGWQYLHPGFRFEGLGAPYVVMRRELAGDPPITPGAG